jgi:hypothetical protein
MNFPALALCALLLAAPAAAAEPSAEVAAAFGGAENLAIVRDGVRADACLLRHVPAPPRPDGSVDHQLERFEETAFVPLDARTTSQLRDLLLSDKTYVNADHTGGHQPQYYVRLRFQRGPDTVAVDFCFHCKILRVLRNGAEVGGASFAGNADLLVDHCARIFPADAALQALAREH